MQNFDTLRANVLQRIVAMDGEVLEQNEIRMALKRPDGFYWETVAPFAELIVTDGNQLWHYQPELEQLVIEDWQRQEAALAAQLLAGETTQLQTDYAVVQTTPEQDARQQFRLTPLAADSLYYDITLGFQSATIQFIRIHDKNGQQTIWEFDQVQPDSLIDDALFRFMPPAGIEIIDHSSGTASP